MGNRLYMTTKDGKEIYYPETPEEEIEFYNERLAEIPKNFLDGAVQCLKDELHEHYEIVEWIKSQYEKNPLNWIHLEHQHHGFGMGIRNFLRDKGFKDDVLPISNWDDYYVQVIELAVGLR